MDKLQKATMAYKTYEEAKKALHATPEWKAKVKAGEKPKNNRQ